MKIKNKKTFSIVIITLSICISILIVTASFAVDAKKESSGEYVIASHGNTVALFVDGELHEVYSDIVLDTLPKQDIDQLKQGIIFPSVEEARSAIEDYDG